MSLKTLALTIGAACIIFPATGQVAINELHVPTSPGFVLLDKSPASIERPATPKALAIDLLNVLTTNDGAIEVAPYWLKSHPNYTFNDWINTRVPVLQTLSISAAGSRQDVGSYMAAGLRTQLLRLYAQKKRMQIAEKQAQIVTALSVEADDINQEELALMRKELNQLQAQSTINIELAAAVSGISANARFQDLGLNRAGAWLNLKYQPAGTALSVLGVARYTRAVNPWSTVPETDSSFADFGLALSYQREAFDLQFEYLRRADLDDDESYSRATLVANYQVIENIVVVASLGKNFSEIENFIGLFGVKFGLSRTRLRM